MGSEQQTSHYTQNGRRPFGYERPSRPQYKFVPSNTRPDLWRKTRSDQSYKRRDARSQSNVGRRFQPNGQNKNYFDFRDRSSSATSNFGDRSSSAASARSVDRSKSNDRQIERKLDKILESQGTLVKRLEALEKQIPKANEVQFTESEALDTGFFINEVFYTTDEVKTSMIVDVGCPSTLAGRKILEKYMKENDLVYSNLPTRDVNMVCKFGETKLRSNKSVDIPIKVKAIDKEGKTGVHYTELPTYIVEGEVPFLLGLNTMEAWNARLDMGEKKGLDIEIENKSKQIKILAPKSGTHLRIGLQPLKEASLENTVLYLQQEVFKANENGNKVTETVNYEYLVKFHKGSGHKSLNNMMHALSQAGMVGPKTKKIVQNVILQCKECKKFGKSLPKPKTTLPKVTDTNQIITWDLKEWKGRHIMWMIDSFSRFVKGIVITNKKKETILKVLYYQWCCQLGYPSQGFWADNGTEFQNETMIEFVITIPF